MGCHVTYHIFQMSLVSVVSSCHMRNIRRNITSRFSLSSFEIEGALDGGSPCRMSVMSNANVALYILRKGRVACR